MQFPVENDCHYSEPLEGYRLLIIEPSTEPHKPLTCRLEHHSWRDVPPYEALSYTWGSEDADISININGKPFLIRRNLHSSLIALRHKHDERILWVDAICINQRDEEEKNKQVQEMGRIYTDAFRVVAWLGDATAHSDQAIALLRRFEQVSGVATDQHVKSMVDFERFYKALMPLATNPDDLPTLEEVFKLLRHPWWTRVWTLQESVMGKQVECVCGLESVPISCFSRFSWFVYLSVNFGVWRGPRIDSSVALRTARWAESLRGRYKQKGLVSVLGAVSASWNRACTEPKDKVMGLLGLIGWHHGDLKPDYRVSVEDNYCRIFFVLLRETRGLYHLGFMSEMPENRNPKLPSWVPDFQIHSGEGSDHLASLSKGIHPYNASLSAFSSLSPLTPLSQTEENFPVTREEGGRTLIVDGIEFDRAQTIGSKAPCWELLESIRREDGPWRENMRETLNQWRSMIHSTGTTYSTGESVVCAFWRTVLVDLKQGDLPKPSSALGALRLDNSDLEWVSDLDSDGTLSRLLLTWEEACKPGYRQLRLIEQLNRRFFVTEKGYFGLGPPSLQADDAVCILRSGAVPYALRKSSNGCWRYVGECYVHGIMDGEVVKEAEQGQYTYQTFRIE